jgi:hypothetical protein
MKERGILFSAPMVLAILSGAKTQTRRAISGRAMESIRFFADEGGDVGVGVGARGEPRVWSLEYPDEGSVEVRCRHGAPGDRLWVRETWQHGTAPDAKAIVIYRADGSAHAAYYEDEGNGDFAHIGEPYAEPAYDLALVKWRSAMFMPRGASRITLEITDVRVQRLHAISETDARAEGCPGDLPIEQTLYDYGNGYMSARARFHSLWDSINGERDGCAWRDNPWVWALSFERVKT